jgi:hypothetical protein
VEWKMTRKRKEKRRKKLREGNIQKKCESERRNLIMGTDSYSAG